MIQTIIQRNDVVHTQEVPLARANQIAGLRTVDEVIRVRGTAPNALLFSATGGLASLQPVVDYFPVTACRMSASHL